MIDSRISGFYRLTVDERLDELLTRGVIDAVTAKQLKNSRGLLSPGIADRMVENVVGVFGLPLAIAPNFLVNGRDYVAPMVIEEPSVVAAVSAAAMLVRDSGGFTATSTEPVTIGQIHIDGMADERAAITRLAAAEAELIALANEMQPGLVERGGGAIDLEIRGLQLADGRNTLALHLLVDVRDAMGANLVNTMCEGIADRVAELAGGNAVLKILSNLADRSMISASARIPVDRLGADGARLRDSIVLANEIALVDPYRAATHNKGIMNGMDAIAIATGNDWRALEAGAHAYAARDGTYRSLTSWSASGNGDLVGVLRLPVRMGIVGGALTANPAAVAGLCIARARSSQELGELMTAVGLAQNFGALRALATTGIQRGHMRLHARSVAMSAGVPRRLQDGVVRSMIESGDIKDWKAKQLVEEFESGHRVIAGDALGRGSASGKIILLGEHAVVYGRPALALPLPEAISAVVYDSPSGTRLKIPAWNFEQEAVHELQQDAAEGAMALLQIIVRRLDLGSKKFLIDVQARIPPAAGLGSSAALAVAMIRALDNAYSLQMNDRAVNELAFECETLAHGTPSGIDNTVAVFGKTIVFRKKGPKRISELALNRLPPLVVAWSGTRGSTRNQVAAVRNRWLQDKTTYERIFDEIGHLTLEASAALGKGDDTRLGALMNIAHGLLNALQISTPLIEEMVDIARSSGAAGAKLTGGGGGGCIVAVCPGKSAEVSRALTAAGFEVISGFAGTGAGDEQG
jgi:hydroxymethylglutaryl-CoA reductase